METFNSPEKWPEVVLKQATSSEVLQVKKSVEYSIKLKNINDVLGHFDFPDEQKINIVKP